MTDFAKFLDFSVISMLPFTPTHQQGEVQVNQSTF
jgi:hypothetical protein